MALWDRAFPPDKVRRMPSAYRKQKDRTDDYRRLTASLKLG